MPIFPQYQNAVLVENANIVAKTASYTAVSGDFAIVSPAAATVVTLPGVALGGPVAVKNLTGAYAVTVKSADGSTIDGIAGTTGFALAKAYDTVVLVSDGSNWWSISGNLATNELPE